MAKQQATPNRRKQIIACLLIVVAVTCISGASYTLSQTTPFKLSSDFAYVLTAYNTSINFDNWLYCDKFGWDNENSTTFLLYNTYMATGQAIPQLSTKTVNGNLTFSSLSRTTTAFTIDNFGSNATITLTGFGAEPNDITIDGSTYTNYTYTKATDQLTFESGGYSVVITYPGSSFTADEILGIAIAFAIAIFGVCFALIIMFRRKQQNE